MRYKTKLQKAREKAENPWFPIFLFTPKEVDGEMIWLEWVEYKYKLLEIRGQHFLKKIYRQR